MTISKSTFASDLFQAIYDRMVATVTSVTLADSSTVTIQTYTSTHPDQASTASSSYPILVVDSIVENDKPHTLKRKYRKGSFSISIFTTKAEAADKFSDAIIESIETYRSSLKSLGLEFVELSDKTSDLSDMGGFKVHIRTPIFTYQYPYTKSAP